MWILQAHSIETDAQKEVDLSSRKQWLLGRSSNADITIEWDPYLSRKQLAVRWDENGVTVERLEESKNRMLFQGEQVDRCDLNHGDEILVGSTLLRFLKESIEEQQALFYEEYSYTSDDLRAKPEYRAERHLEILSSLPELIEHKLSTESLIDVVLQLLSQGITEADGIIVICDETLTGGTLEAAATVRKSREESTTASAKVCRHFSRATLPPPQISQRLWKRALRLQHGALLHFWDQATTDGGGDIPLAEMTIDSRYDWAFCVPVVFTPQQTHGIYVYGHCRVGDASQRDRIDADIRFCSLLIEITSAIVRSRQLDKQRVLLEQFLPRDIARYMVKQPESTLLDPRECDLTVVYCDVQGFTARAERAGDQLFEFLEQISEELSCASRAILKFGGVIGDFHGDAVMGFWGWPLDNVRSAELACQAALELQQNLARLREQETDPTRGRMRVGIASGHALAGKIGTTEQVKVTAFGTVVNRAERLQELSKKTGNRILVDAETYEKIPAETREQQFHFEPLPEMEVPGIPERLKCLRLHSEPVPSSTGENGE